ncbi:hypothetical protein TWF281_003297 [Arthrobotrys megalospora]
MAPDIVGLGPPSKRRRVSPDGEVAASGSADSSRTLSSQSQHPYRRKLPPIARQHMPADAAATLPSSLIEPLLEQSIALVLKSYGFDGGTKVALNNMRQMAGQFLQDITTNAMAYCTSQRRTRPTITDYEESLDRSGYTVADLEDEIIRYRQSQTQLPDSQEAGKPNLTNGTKTPIPKPHIYKLPNPDPAPPDEPSLIDLLGPELLKPRRRYKVPAQPRPAYLAKLEQDHPGNPKFATQTKPMVTLQTERSYIDPHQPAWPGKHTYEHHDEVREIVRDAKKLRELASEEARQSGETLRKLLAEFSKASTATRNRGEANGGSAKKSGTEVYKGGNARRKRDEMFEKTWMNVIKSIETEKDKAKAEVEEKRRQRRERREQAKNGAVNGLFGGVSLMEIDFEDESSEDEELETLEKETQIDEKGLLDTVVNCEKGLFAKGTMRRVMFR